MSYTEEQTRLYNSMMYDLQYFEEMKKRLSKNRCVVHNKRLKMEANWEKEYDTAIIISKYCCEDFAAQIAMEFIETKRFTSVKITLQ